VKIAASNIFDMMQHCIIPLLPLVNVCVVTAQQLVLPEDFEQQMNMPELYECVLLWAGGFCTHVYQTCEHIHSRPFCGVQGRWPHDYCSMCRRIITFCTALSYRAFIALHHCYKCACLSVCSETADETCNARLRMMWCMLSSVRPLCFVSC